MRPERWRRVEEILDRLLDAEPGQRPALLQELCVADPALQREVERLVAAGARSWRLLDAAPESEPLRALLGELDGAEPLPGPIGPYTPISELGRGGMGVVYLAEQQGPLKRQVALKIIQEGLGSKEVLARFESERQALALMEHPTIARVFDAGTTAGGQPYFAMEYVPGVPLTDYCDEHRLSLEERLELFIEVCEGVQHAHQKGVIHRDLKPSNILVVEADGQPRAKVIDFGVAKALHQRLTDKTLFTRLDMLVGTPEYMSPEQADPGVLGVDTRSDVYSLGAILYELLTGSLPFERERFRKASYSEIVRILREEEPPRPSRRISTVGARAEETAQRRRSALQSLVRRLRGDLDWVTLKALEKDRAQRYPSASEVAADLRRHLEHLPVVARQPNVRYRVGKFVRRHRALAVATAAALVLLLAGVTISTTLYLREQAARREAEGQVRRAEASKLVAIGRLQLEENGTAALAYAIASLELADQELARRFALDALSRGPTAIFAAEPGTRIPADYRTAARAAQFSPDGRWLAEGRVTGDVRLWPLDGRASIILEGHRGMVEELYFPAADVLVSVGRDLMRAWSVPEGTAIMTLESDLLDSQQNLVGSRSAGAILKGSLLTFAHRQSERRVVFEAWPLVGGPPRSLGWLSADLQPVIPIQATPIGSGGYVAAFSRGNLLYLTPLERLGTVEPRRIGAHREPIVQITFSQAGGLLASSDTSEEVRVWSLDSATERPLRTLQGHQILSIGLDPLGLRLASVGYESIQVWDLDGPPEADPMTLRLGTAGFRGVPSFHPGGHWLAAASAAGTQVWPLGRAYPRVLSGISGEIWRVAFTPDGKWLTSTSTDGAVRVWPLAPGMAKRHRIVLQGDGGDQSYPLAVDPSGKYLLACKDEKGGISLVNLQLDSSRELTGFSSRVVAAAFDSSGRLAAAGGAYLAREANLVRIWDLESGEVKILDPGAEGGKGINDIGFTPDGGLLSAGLAGLRLWRLDDASSSTLRQEAVAAIDLTRDGQKLLLGGEEGVFLLDLRNGRARELAALSGRSEIWDVALDPSGTVAVTGDEDGVVRVGPVTGGPAHLLLGHTGGVGGVAVSPDGRWIASGSDDQTIRIWPMPEGQPLHSIPYPELLARLRTLTNLRAVPDPQEEDGYHLEVESFPGWKTLLTW